MGGLWGGGVRGLSAIGLGVLLLSSVMPVELPVAVVSEVPEVAEAKGAMALGGGLEVVGERRMLKRALCKVVVSVDGADLRLSMLGAE